MRKTKAEAVLPALSQLLNSVLKPGHYNAVWKSPAQTLQDLGGLLYVKYLPRYSGRGRTELNIYGVKEIKFPNLRSCISTKYLQKPWHFPCQAAVEWEFSELQFSAFSHEKCPRSPKT